MHQRLPHLLSAMALITLLCSNAHAACNARFESGGRTAYSTDYDPFVGGKARIDVEFTLSNNGSNLCQLELSIINPDAQQTLANGAFTLPFAVGEAHGWNVVTSGNTLATKRVQLPANMQPSRQTVVFEIPREQVVAVGSYRRQLRITGRNTETSAPLPNERMISIAADVLPRVQAKASFNAGPFDSGGNITSVDLGVLRSGLRNSIYLKFRGTTDACVTISSENGGMLRNQTSPSLTPIPYDVEMNGARRTLRSPLVVSQSVPQNANGISSPLTFIISDTTNKLSGTYKDILKVSTVAN